MSSDAAITVEGIGKRYRLLTRKWAGRFVEARPEAVDGDHFWALRDVTFGVEHGETLGLIGRNGSGKSTLLGILSRITDPTEGRARTEGRVGSLLEVGAGFHPDISGRENIAMMGAILGMRRQETRARFDEIVDFAEVSAFIDTPVKFYSTGMYLRLAFAVAAHLDSEILLLDEALAVGDQQFRERCLTKIRDLASNGRTVMFVSHDATSVTRLCKRALLIEHGRVVFDGATDEAMRRYRGLLEPPTFAYVAEGSSDDIAHIAAVQRVDPRSVQPVGEPLTLEIELHVSDSPRRDLNVLVEFVGPDLWPVTGAEFWLGPSPGGSRRTRCSVPTLRLAPSRYTITVTLREGNQSLESLEQLCPFEVTGISLPGSAWLWRYLEDADWSDGSLAGSPGGTTIGERTAGAEVEDV
jgi:homopolymeric O-antigen transport system ATP-binding protein